MKNSLFKKFLFLLFSLNIISCSNTSQSIDNKTLIVALGGDEISGLDPSVMETDVGSYRIGLQIYDRLLELTPEGTLKKGRITKNIQQIDKKTYVFTLNKDIYFHDKTLLTSQDVVFSLKRSQKSLFTKNFFTPIKDISVIDDSHLKITTIKTINSTLLYNRLAQVPASIFSRKAYLKNPKKFFQHPIGSGAFLVKKYLLNHEIILERFHHSSSKNSQIKTIVFRLIPNSNSRILALKNKEVDIAFELNPKDGEEVLKNKNSSIKIISKPSLTLNYLGINNKKYPFNNLKVRYLLYHLLNKEALTKGTYGQFAHSAYNFLPPSIDSRKILPKNSLGFIQKHSKEMKLLKEKPLTLVIENDIKRSTMASILQNQFQQQGITINIKKLDWGAYINTLLKGEFDLFIYPESTRFFFPSYFLHIMFSKNNAIKNNLSLYYSKDIENSLNKLDLLQNKNQQNKMIEKILEQVKKDMPLVPINFPNQIIGYQPYIHNLPLRFDSLIDFQNTTKKHAPKK